jgi:hypothetical protein
MSGPGLMRVSLQEHLMGINKKGQHRLHLYLTFLTYHLLGKVKLLNKTTVFVGAVTLVENPRAYGSKTDHVKPQSSPSTAF